MADYNYVVPDLRLDGKVVLITGTGGGQGRAAAILFAASGAIVVGCDVNAETNDETVALVQGRGGTMHGAVVNLSDPERARTWVEDAAQAHGRVDVVYNNGSSARFGPVGEMRIEDWQHTIRNELDLVFYVTRYAWRFLVESHGLIINVASVAGHTGSKAAPQSAHCAAKGGVLAFTKQIAVEGAPVGIRAVSISPGLIETPATRELLKDQTARDIMLADSLIKRPGQPEEIASVALFLASGGASFITGSDFIVDGGRQAI